MLNRRIVFFLLLVCLTTAGCRDRWRHTSRGVGYARSRGYNACVDSPGYDLPPPEQMLRAESRELRSWYRELNVAARGRQYSRGRVRGRLPRGVHGPQAAHGAYYDDGGYYSDGCDECGCCSDCCDCQMNFGGQDCGMPADLGCQGSFPTMGDGWNSYSQTANGGFPGGPSHHACPVCGHSGPAYQIDPNQVVPHQPQEPQYQYVQPLQQMPPAPTYSAPPVEPSPTVPTPPPAAPMPPLDDMAPAAVPEPMPSAVTPTYFAPPIR